jgi:dTDP-4-amino-4,6-dideoxygalactose transaminase
MHYLGFNYRITDIQAALGVSQFKKLNKFIARRREIVNKYNQAFKNIPNLVTPIELPGLVSAFHLYVLKINFQQIGKSRKDVIEELKAKGVGTQVHYIPVHLQPFYQNVYGYKQGDYPVTEAYYDQCLSLPLFPRMTSQDVDKVIEAVKAVARRAK